MKTSNRGLDLIKKYEGLPKVNKDGKYPPYICPTGYPSLGYGSRYIKGRSVKMTDSAITKEEADLLLVDTIVEYEDIVNKAVLVPITQNQFDALVSFVYNLGGTNFRSSTLLRELNMRNYTEAANQFNRWVFGTVRGKKQKLNGLITRRLEESTIFKE